MRSLRVAGVAAISAVVLLGGCSALSSSSSSSTSPTPATNTAVACSLLTKSQVASATGDTIQLGQEENVGSTNTCTFASLSGFAIVLSVVNAPGVSLTSDIPGLGNLVSNDHLSQVSGIGDQAYAGTNAIVARKGDTAFSIVYGSFSSGNHETALKTMAGDVVAHL
jgi:2-phospho-L-lactate guanylyltransferase (CobY/MobA/RfbA family)